MTTQISFRRKSMLPGGGRVAKGTQSPSKIISDSRNYITEHYIRSSVLYTTTMQLFVHDDSSVSPPRRRRYKRRRIYCMIVIVLLIVVFVILNLLSLQEDNIFHFLDDFYYSIIIDGQQQQQQSAPINFIIPNQYSSLSSSSKNNHNNIRKWGCNRHETPLIFVHLGKAGGGLVRARIAASAINYKRNNMWHQPKADKHYYPIIQQIQQQQKGKKYNGSSSSSSNKVTITKTKIVKGKFCNSNNKNHRIPNSIYTPTSFEGNSICNATTPIGLGIACPEHTTNTDLCLGCNDMNSIHCHTVYVGHNNIGSEFHWLPPKFLKNWWINSPWFGYVPEIDTAWDTLLLSQQSQQQQQKQQSWCFGTRTRPMTTEEFDSTYQECSLPMAALLDNKFQTYWNRKQQQRKLQTKNNKSKPNLTSSIGQQQQHQQQYVNNDYSTIYSSLPVQRITVLREPFSFLISKFFFHKRYREGYLCDNIEEASQTWALRDTLTYIFQYCGDDCSIRYENGLISNLDELEIQATNNIRHSFSVVGILEEYPSADGKKKDGTTSKRGGGGGGGGGGVEMFYDMVTKRVGYLNLNMSRNILQVEGNSHQHQDSSESERCKEIFLNDEGFQNDFMDRLPTLAIIKRLYQVAIDVNQFQREELKQC